MKKTKGLLITAINIVVIAGLLGFLAYRAFAQEANVAVSTNKTTLAPGEQVEITLSLENAEQGTYKALEGILSFDKNVFQSITIDDLTALNEWTGFEYNETSQKFVLYRKEVKQNAFLKVKLTALTTLNADSTEVSINKFYVSNGKKDILSTAKTEITLNKNAPVVVPDPEPKPDPIPDPTPTPDPTPKPDPTPTPDPTPKPDPTPTPKPDPTPTPTPTPNTTPTGNESAKPSGTTGSTSNETPKVEQIITPSNTNTTGNGSTNTGTSSGNKTVTTQSGSKTTTSGTTGSGQKQTVSTTSTNKTSTANGTTPTKKTTTKNGTTTSKKTVEANAEEEKDSTKKETTENIEEASETAEKEKTKEVAANENNSNGDNAALTNEQEGFLLEENASEKMVIGTLNKDEEGIPLIIWIIVGAGALLLLGIIGLVIYFIYKKRKAAAGLLFLAALIFANQMDTKAAELKGDINKDGLCNVEDYKMLAKHLAGITTIEQRYRTIVDMNSDEMLTVTDLAILLDYELINVKATPEVSDVTISENAKEEKITVHFVVTDTDATIKAETGLLSLRKGSETVKTVPVTVGENIAEFDVVPNVDYQLNIHMEYDRVPGNADYSGVYENTLEYILIKDIDEPELKDETLGHFQLKDVEDVVFINSAGELFYDVNVSTLNTTDYFVEVYMKDLPALYAGLKSISTANNELVIELDYDNSVSYVDGERTMGTFINVGPIENGVLVRDTFEKLLQKIEQNPTGEITLTHDYDAKGLTSAATMVDSGITFKGTLNGNGYTIKNLPKGLFTKIENATIKNLNIANAVTSGARGIIAVECVNSTIENVSFTNSRMQGCGMSAGGIVGIAKNSTLRNIAVENLELSGTATLGGIAGENNNNTKIENCFVSGTITGNISNDLGTRIGGISGWHSGATIDKCVTNVKIASNTQTGNGGIIGGPRTGSAVVKNSVSLSTGNGYAVAGFEEALSAENVYALNQDITAQSKVTAVTESTLKTAAFYTNTLGLSTDNWELKDVAATGVPELKKNIVREAQSENINVYIPNYADFSTLDGYDSRKDILYHNLYKLEPFYELGNLIEDAGKLPVNHLLNQNYIKDIIPFNAQNQAVFGLSKSHRNAITSIKIIYEDDSVTTHPVSYKDNYNFVANYVLTDICVGYNFDKYLVDTSLPIFTNNLSKIHAMDFNTTLNPLTEEDERRIIYLNFPHVKENGSEFLVNLIANNPEYQSSKSNRINNFIRNQLFEERMLEYLYAYNYFDRLYNINVNGINIRDIVFFDLKLFSDMATEDTITSAVMEANGSRETWNNVTLYNNKIKPYTGKSMGDFIEYFIRNLTEEQYKENPNAWFHKYFKGYIYEAPAVDFMDPDSPDFLEYRAWEHLKRRENFMLAFLTYPYDDLYFVTYPTAMMYGNLRLYFSNWDTDHPTQEALDRKIAQFTDNAATLYNTVAHVVDEATVKRMSGRTDIVHDTTLNKNLEGLDRYVTNQSDVDKGAEPKYATVDPVYKYVNEFIKQWHGHGSAAAYANTVGGVFYCFYKTLDNYTVWTHENVHNQDGYLYFEGKGRRLWSWHGNSENFADGLLTQQKDNTTLIANYSQDYPWEDNIGYNQSYKRFIGSTKEESRSLYHSFYKNAVEAKRFLDYLEGLAFFELTPQQQANIATTIDFVKTVDGKRVVMTAAEIEEMQKNTCIPATGKFKHDAAFYTQAKIDGFDDLFDKNIAIERTWIKGQWERGSGMVTNFMVNIPFNNAGMVGEGFKNNAFIMAAEGGYDAFSTWGGGQFTSDLEVLRYVTGNPNITYREYTLGKYNEVGTKAASSGNFGSEAVAYYKNLFKEALIHDGENDNVSTLSEGYILREILYTRLKRMTNDFRTSIFDVPSTVSISSASQLINAVKNNPLGTYVLQSDLDFGSIAGGENAIIDETFMGEIHGNGHVIRNLSKPLFDQVKYARIDNLSIEDATINMAKDWVGTLSNYIYYSIVKDITLENINTVGQDSTGGLIGRASRSVFENVVLLDSIVGVNSGKERCGGLFGYIESSSILRCHVKDLTLNGASRAGGLLGEGTYMFRIKECSVVADVIGGQNSGGFAGRLSNGRPESDSKIVARTFVYNTVIEDNYVSGTVKLGNSNVGGFLGYGENITVNRCYSNVSFEPSNQNGGGFIGFIGYTDGSNGQIAKLSLTNSISFSDVTRGYKFDGTSRDNFVERAYRNNYEYKESTGNSTLSRDTIDWNGKVSVLEKNNATNMSFYKNNLGFSEKIWDMTHLQEDGKVTPPVLWGAPKDEKAQTLDPLFAEPVEASDNSWKRVGKKSTNTDTENKSTTGTNNNTTISDSLIIGGGF